MIKLISFCVGIPNIHRIAANIVLDGGGEQGENVRNFHFQSPSMHNYFLAIHNVDVLRIFVSLKRSLLLYTACSTW